MPRCRRKGWHQQDRNQRTGGQRGGQRVRKKGPGEERGYEAGQTHGWLVVELKGVGKQSKRVFGKESLGVNAKQSSVHRRRSKLLYTELLYSIAFQPLGD